MYSTKLRKSIATPYSWVQQAAGCVELGNLEILVMLGLGWQAGDSRQG